MNKKRRLGFLLLVVGFVIMVGTSPRITGNVVLDGFENLVFIRLIGIVFFVGGILLMSVSISVRQGPITLEDLLDEGKVKSKKTRPIIVMDEGGIIENIDEFRGILRSGKFSQYGMKNIVVPSRIRQRILRGHDYRDPVFREFAERTNNETNSPNIKELYTQIAEYVLDNSGKNRMRKELLPRIDGWIEDSRNRAIRDLMEDNSKEDLFRVFKKRYRELSRDISSDDFNEIVENIEKYDIKDQRELVRDKNIITTSREYRDLRGLAGGSSSGIRNIFDMKDYLEHDFKEKDLDDINVVGTVLYELRNTPKSKKILVYAKDIDIRESIENMRKDIPYLEKQIDKDVEEGRIPRSRFGLLDRLLDGLKRVEYRSAG